jgi:hypothetical protein
MTTTNWAGDWDQILGKIRNAAIILNLIIWLVGIGGRVG